MEETRFRPEYRLHQASEFAAVFQHRRVLRGILFDLHWRPNGLETARLGLVVPKRLARRAVQRNLIKRLSRELFRRRRSSLPALDLVFKLARKPGAKSVKDTKDSVAVAENKTRSDVRREFRTEVVNDFEALLHKLPGAPR